MQRSSLPSLAHLEHLKDQVAKTLDPKFSQGAPAAAAPAGRARIEDTCWPASDEAYD